MGIIINFKIILQMFKKISFLATVGAAADAVVGSVDTVLCTKQDTTSVTAYATGINCQDATIKIEGGKTIPAENLVTDGYQAVLSLGFLTPNAAATLSLSYGVCVIPVVDATTETGTV